MDQQHPYTLLTPDRVLAAVASAGFEPDARIFTLNSYENRVYQVGLVDGSFLVAKFYRPGRWNTPQILEEHGFAGELANLEIPVVAPLDCDGGGTLLEFEGFQFALFPLLRGRAPELDSPDSLRVMGRFIGRIHGVGATRSFSQRPVLSVERFAVSSREFLLQHDFIPDDLQQAYATLSADLISRIEGVLQRHGPLETLRIHGDCHLGNVLWQEGVPHFVDFDDTMSGPAIQDLWMMLSGERDQRQAQLLELVEGYNEFYRFRPVELQLVESLRTLRIMHYSAWLARRWQDPAFPRNFPWFNSPRYWAEHVLELREQLAALEEAPLELLA